MTVVIRALQEAAFVAGAVPLVAYLGFRRDHNLPPEIGLVAGALFVSFLMDAVSLQLGHFHLNNWWVGYIGYPVQYGMMGAALLHHRSMKVMAALGFGVMALAAALRGTLGEPETFTRVVGGLVICFLVWGVPALHRYQVALWIYCGVTIPSVLAMGFLSMRDEAWLGAWGTYQALRLLGLGLLTWALVRKEAPTHAGPRRYQRGRPEVDGEYRALLSRVSGHRLPQTAKR